jgi:SAM-dependent methyltransferase
MFNKIKSFYKGWRIPFEERRKYCTMDRFPFYDIAAEYLPEDKESIVVDIGAGNGSFVKHLNLSDRYKNLYLLDGNRDSVDKLKSIGKNAILYTAPDKLPFNDNSVSFIHCSHLVEHLDDHQLYAFLREIDRVLLSGGLLVISSPLLWDKFYDDLSHKKPYNPSVFIKYLGNVSDNYTRETISTKYEVQKLVYRYYISDLNCGVHSKFAICDFFISLLRKACLKVGFANYKKNGFTLVLRKNS